MEFFIKKNASLPILSFLVVKDGRSDYHRFMDNLSGSTITFSMFNFDTGVAKVTSKTAKIVTPNPENPSEVYLSIQLTSKNTNKVGRYEAQVSIKNDKGQFIFPLEEKIFINVVDSFVFNTECCPPSDSYPPFIPVTTTTTSPVTTTTTILPPINDLNYLIIPSNDLYYNIIVDNDLGYVIIPNDDINYIIIPNDTLGYLIIPTNDINYEILYCTGGTYTLVTLPYEPPSSGNTIFPGFTYGFPSGTTNPNTFDVDGIYWNVFDNTGVDLYSYYSALTNPFIISFSQNGDTAIYSGVSGSIDFIIAPFPPFEGVFFHDLSFPSGQQPLTLIQPSINDFVEGQDVCISFDNIIIPTGTPTPTETPTPTPTETPTPTPTETPTPTPTETPTPTPTETPTPTPTETPTPTPCINNIVVPTLWNGVTIINTNLLQLTQTSETLLIQVGYTITDNIGNTSIVGTISSDGTYTYVGTGPGGSFAFNCQFPLTFSGPC